MNKFQEMLNLYAHGISDIDKVLASRWNKALLKFDLLSDEKKEVAKTRLDICKTCPFNSINAKTSKEYTDFKVNGIINKNSLTENSSDLYPFLESELHYFTNRDDKDIHCSWCSCKLEDKVLSMESNCGVENYNLLFRMGEELKWKKLE